MYTSIEEYRSWIKSYINDNPMRYNELYMKHNKIYTHDCIKIKEQKYLINNKLPVEFGYVKSFHVKNVDIFDMYGLPHTSNSIIIESCNTLQEIDLSHTKCNKHFELVNNLYVENIILPLCNESFIAQRDCYDVLIEHNTKLNYIDFKNISTNEYVDVLMKFNANTQIFKMLKNIKHFKKFYAINQTISDLNGIDDFSFDTLKLNIRYLRNFNHIEKTKTQRLVLYYPNISNMHGFINILKAFIGFIAKPDGISFHIDPKPTYDIYTICDKFINNIQQSSRIDYSMDMVLEFLDSHQIDIS